MGSNFDRTDYDDDIVQTMLEEVGGWSEPSCNGSGVNGRSTINTTTAPAAVPVPAPGASPSSAAFASVSVAAAVLPVHAVPVGEGVGRGARVVGWE